MEDEGRTETEREREDPEPDEGEPWDKTSSGDAESVTEDE